MLDGLVTIFTSSGLGAIIGLFGSWLTKREEIKSMELKLDYELRMANIRKSEAELEFGHQLAMADKKQQQTETEGAIARDLASAEAFAESIKEHKKTYRIKFVDAIRGLMRPLITIYLLILATIVALKIGGFVGEFKAFARLELVELYKDTVTQMIFLATTAVAWWFGSRPSSQRKG